MSIVPWVDAREIPGVQHCHGEDCDEYYFRPLVFGDEIFTYIAHMPPGGGASGDQAESEMFEMSLYVLDGEATVTKGKGTPEEVEEVYVLHPHTAMDFPRGQPLGIWNRSENPTTLLMSFSPVGEGGPQNMEEYRVRVESSGRSLFSPEEMNSMAGIYLSP